LSLFGLSFGVVPDAQAAMSYSFKILDIPGATGTEPRSINASGQVTGYYWDGPGTHGFVYSNGTFATLDVPGATSTFAASINASGQVVGNYSDGSGTHGFIATPIVTDIPTLSQWALLLGGGLLVGMAVLAQVRRTRPLRG
jgi:probable HAF family extracellular repeat protein